MLRDSVRAIAPPGAGLDRVRGCRFHVPGHDPLVTATMAEMGWFALMTPETHGGLGLGMKAYCALARSLGAALVPEPLIAIVLGCRLAQDGLPDGALEGRPILIPAWQERPGKLDWSGRVSLRNGEVDGSKVHVSDADAADIFVVPTDGAVALLDRNAPGVELESRSLQDGTFEATLHMRGAPARIAQPADIDIAIEEATLATAAYLHGVAERAFELTLDHIRNRVQFGRPIGSYQALQHRAADIAIQLALSEASISAAAQTMGENRDLRTSRMAVSRAKSRACDTAMMVAREGIQMHGAIGFTDEHDIGLFARKTMTLVNRFGSPAQHRARHGSLLA